MTAFTERHDAENTKKKNSLLKFREKEEADAATEELLHSYGKDARIICDTDVKGHETPNEMSLEELAVHTSEGFVPLWGRDVTLRWRFQDLALMQFQNRDEITSYVENLFGQGVRLWGDAAPIRFQKAQDAWDFEIVIMAENKCRNGGCTLASAFFPDAGRHQLRIYPRMFDQDTDEQAETMAHEIGHIFGLRHFFANISETQWPVEIIGDHQPFSIMNYGAKSEMTDRDRGDLKMLYRTAWAGEFTHINSTPIKLVRPFSAQRLANPGLELIAAHRMVPGE